MIILSKGEWYRFGALFQPQEDINIEGVDVQKLYIDAGKSIGHLIMAVPSLIKIATPSVEEWSDVPLDNWEV